MGKTSVVVTGGIYAGAQADIPVPDATIGGDLDDDIIVIPLPEKSLGIHFPQDGLPILTVHAEGFGMDDVPLAKGDDVELRTDLKLTHKSGITLSFLGNFEIEEDAEGAAQEDITDTSKDTTPGSDYESEFLEPPESDTNSAISGRVLTFSDFLEVEVVQFKNIRDIPGPVLGLWGVGVIAILSLISISMVSGNMADQPTSREVVAEPMIADMMKEKSAKTTDSIALKNRLGSARGFLEDELEKAQLYSIQISEDESSLRASGQYLTQARVKWEDIQSLYDVLWSAQIPLVIEATEVNPEPPLRVQSIWLGSRRSFRTVYGETFNLGDETPDGWKIVKINIDFVMLERNKVLLRVPVQ